MTTTQETASALLAELQRLTELRPVLEAAERGERVDERGALSGFWRECLEPTLFDRQASEYRIAPRAILVNGIEVPEPMREAPASRVEYWMPRFSMLSLAVAYQWEGCEFDNVALARGLVHPTKEAAEAHARAMLAASSREGV